MSCFYVIRRRKLPQFAEGDTATQIREVSSNISSFVDFNDSDLEINLDNGWPYSEKDWEWCASQFERILGMAINAFISSEEWYSFVN